MATGYSLKDTESAGLGGNAEILSQLLAYDLGRQDYIVTESTFSLYNHSIYNRPLKCVFFFFLADSCVARGILAPWVGVKPTPLALEPQNVSFVKLDISQSNSKL